MILDYVLRIPGPCVEVGINDSGLPSLCKALPIKLDDLVNTTFGKPLKSGFRVDGFYTDLKNKLQTVFDSKYFCEILRSGRFDHQALLVREY